MILAALVLTYSILGGPTQLAPAESDAVMEQAMGIWAEAGQFTARRVSTDEKADIRILWVFGAHPPCTAEFLPRRTGMLAHTYYPPISECHFNRAEWWDADRLLGVAVHEIGHALGLDHADEPDSVMYGWYVGTTKPNCGDRAIVRYLLRQKGSK